MRRDQCSCLARLLLAAAAALGLACSEGSESESETEIITPVIDSGFEVQPGTVFEAIDQAKFGGLSSLAFDVASGNLLALSDDRQNNRIFRLQIRENPFAVAPFAVIPLLGAPVELDPEGLAILPNGHFLIASEGVQNKEPRSPPGLFEFTSDGQFMNTLELRERFLPPETGPITHGVRGNASFESLTVAVDGSRLFAGVETALAQDGEPATFEHGTRTRILEYMRDGQVFAPGREWVYELEPLPRPAYNPGVMINGLVELVAVDASHLLALERAFVENADDPAHSTNRVQIYRVSLNGGTDVSGLDSIAGRADVTPLRKELVLDLGGAPGLPAALKATNLENFEGMTFGPAPPDGGRRLFIVSDDNFADDQRTWFLRLTF
jgi:3-phytase